LREVGEEGGRGRGEGGEIGRQITGGVEYHGRNRIAVLLVDQEICMNNKKWAILLRER
jgi:hypothetical protein